MRSSGFAFALIAASALSSLATAGPEREVVAPSGGVARTLSAEGVILEEHRFADATPKSAPASDPTVERVEHRDPSTGRSVDSEGRVSDPNGDFEARGEKPLEKAQRITIDRMTFGVTYSETYRPDTGFVLFGPAKYYYLSDGTSWRSGAGTYYRTRAIFDRAEIDGTTIRYYFDPPIEGFVYKQTDYDAGDHSSNGSLAAAGPLVLEAALGASTGTMSGDVSVLSNVPANASEPVFNYWAAPLGSVIPFEASFNLHGGTTFTETTFDATFSYSNNGEVDFTDPSSIPPLSSVEVIGSAQVRPGTTAQFHAVATYESGARLTVTSEAEWSVSPAGSATIDGGELVAGKDCAGETIEIAARYSAYGSTETGRHTVECREIGSDEWVAYWETYQGDERHTGYVPISLEPDVFALRWQREIAPDAPLNPVTAADGKVFVSRDIRFNSEETLFVLDARDGEVLWSRAFDDPNSVNPPAYGYGNVYIQTSRHSNATYLWAFDADTGDVVFQSPHSAQWERYYAPTIYDGKVYVNGGYYGGMYAFDAFSGANEWFYDLQQYDQFTPAVDEDHVYAYVGEYSPGLYVVERETGRASYLIRDPNFDWNGWSMDLAPVLGSMDDVIAIHDGRLIQFDLAGRQIGYEIQERFSGQPSVAKGTIYAINGGRVEARSEADGGLQWSWTPPDGAVATEHVIVTDTHVIARTDTHTYAIEILSGEAVWSFEAAGHLSLGEETLYIAAENGFVTAISIPEYAPASLDRVEIEGPADAREFTTTSFEAFVHYDDGRVRKRTDLTGWSVEPTDYASINRYGELSVGEMLVPTQEATVRAVYREGEVEVSDTHTVTLGIGISLGEFVDRNAASALDAKHRALAALEEAARYEQAAIAVVGEGAPGRASQARGHPVMRLLNALRRAFFWGEFGQSAVENGVSELEAVLEERGRSGAPTPGE